MKLRRKLFWAYPGDMERRLVDSRPTEAFAIYRTRRAVFGDARPMVRVRVEVVATNPKRKSK